VTPSAQYCLDLVRENDRDRYLAAMFAPDDARPRLLALGAFDVDVRRIAREVSDPHIGLIRLQWWQETLQALEKGETVAHPVAEALAEARQPLQPLRNLLEAREFDLFDDPMPHLATLEGYLGETASAMIQLGVVVLAPKAATKVAPVSGLAGVALGIARLLSTGAAARKFLPRDWVAATDETAARERLAAHARRRLAEARHLLPEIPPAALPAFLPVSLTELYLKARPPSQFRRQLALWWAARNNRF
jgi:15-cis-phytoene synthase